MCCIIISVFCFLLVQLWKGTVGHSHAIKLWYILQVMEGKNPFVFWNTSYTDCSTEAALFIRLAFHSFPHNDILKSTQRYIFETLWRDRQMTKTCRQNSFRWAPWLRNSLWMRDTGGLERHLLLKEMNNEICDSVQMEKISQLVLF